MAEEFEVRGLHEEHMDHAAEHEPAGMAAQLAVVTAILATVGAMFSYMAGSTQAAAGLLKNEAAIKKTEAADQWNFFQAKSSKQSLSELGMELVPAERKAFFAQQAARYNSEKADIKRVAEGLDRESDALSQRSEEQLHVHHRWAQATTVVQIAIALAAIALLTRRRWLEFAVLAMGAGGLALGAMALLQR